MTKKIIFISILIISIFACTDEIDKSNRYTFTGETIADYMLNRSDKYSHFINILKRAELLTLLSTYGQYTLFLPDNDGVEKFLQEQDSIYHATKDTKTPIWTGITSPYFDDLSDSMAIAIAKTHLLEGNHRSTDFGEGALTKWNFKDQYLGINYKADGEQLHIMVNNYATITSRDNEVENGIIHKTDKIISDNQYFISEAIGNYTFFSIFNKALQATGLGDSLRLYIDNNYTQKPVVGFLPTLYNRQYPTKKYYKYTAFIETDEVFNKNGIYTLDELKAFAEKWYGTEDKENPKSHKNALYKFVAYHFTKGEMPYNKLIISRSHSQSFQHYDINYDITDYFESISGRLMKIVKPLSTTDGQNIYLNYSKRKMPYKAEMLKHLNIRILETTYFTQLRKEYSQFNPLSKNGVIHPIDKILVYDEDEMSGNIFNERMRFDVATLIPELSSHNMRYQDSPNLIPYEFCQNIKNNFTTSHFYYGVSPFRYFGDDIVFEGDFDFSIRLPQVPHKTYEIRISRNTGYGLSYENNPDWQNKIQIYLDQKVYGLPFDTRILSKDPQIGWIDDTATYDNGVENDRQMRNRGWMKAPDSYLTMNNNITITAREHHLFVRKIIGTAYLGEGEHWLRFRCVENCKRTVDEIITPDFELDYIEIVPLNIINDLTKPEDRH